MKIFFTTLLTVLLYNTVLANDKLKDGVFTSPHGEVHILNSKSGNKAVGLYNKYGHILLSPFTITGRGTVYTGAFSNNCKNGLVSFSPNSTNGWNGNYKWKTTTGFNKWDGGWNGTLQSTNFPNNELTETFQTKLGTMQLIQNSNGRVAGFLYTNNKEFYVYGDYKNKQFKGYITSDENTIKCNTGFTLSFDWNHGIYGTVTVPGFSKQNFRGSESRNLLELKFQTIKNYANKGRPRDKEWGKINITMILYDDIGTLFTRDLYTDQTNKRYQENQSYDVNRTVSGDIFYSLVGPAGYYSNPRLGFSFTHRRTRASNAEDRLRLSTISLKSILEYLNFQRDASSFVNGPDGRKIIPDSDHTFWLTEANGKRTVRGYAFIKYGNDDKWGYFYTLKLK
ncbi:hypothetical protein [Nonlabens sp. Asnod3-H03]|uniref:hypothetical protein n=1 Tax=Nonlabens sp. Asnod3-H03 TaxID=3160580 RepID=UPI0038673433